MNRIFHDVRYAFRWLRKSPAFALTAILTLAFGIGATTAIYSIVEGVLLRPLPFPDPQRLVLVGDVPDGVELNRNAPALTAPAIAIYRRNLHLFSGLGGFRQTGFEFSANGEPAQISAGRLSASVFSVLGVSPLLGRAFSEQEDQGKQQVAVLSNAMWRNRFHGDPNIVGTKIQLNRNTYEVVGVMPRDFEFPLVAGQLYRSELWVPLSLTQSELLSGAGSWSYQLIGRLKPGIAPAQIPGDMQTSMQEIERGFPAAMVNMHIHPSIQPLIESTVSQARPLLRTLFLAVAVVLFIACANLAGLLLVRVIRRKRDISVRLAIGASRGAIVRQSLIETMLLSLTGGLLGLALAATALRVGIRWLPESLPRIAAIDLDWKVACFALLLALLTGLVCGLIPAFAAARTDVNEAIKEGGRTGLATGGHARLRSVLVVAQLAVALVLLTASGLLLRSFERLRSVDLGFRADHVLTASYGLPHQQYSSQAAIDAFNRALLEKLRQLPGVQSVGITSSLPAAGNRNQSVFVPEGYVIPKGAGLIVGWPAQVSGDYFRAQGVTLLRGREFTDADNATTPLVAIVNRSLAERYWPGQNPMGRRIRFGLPQSSSPWLTVVGETADVKQTAVDSETMSQFYVPVAQYKQDLGPFATADMLTGNYGAIVLRGQMEPEQMKSALRAVVHTLDPQLSLMNVASMESVVAGQQTSRRFSMVVVSIFASAAVLLALLGIYSVIAFSAALRAHELAIRLALGSDRSAILRLVLASGARMGLAGCAIGFVGALFAMRLLRSMLFEVSPLDPLVLALATCAVLLLALLASAMPARRAASIDPMQALRNE